MLGHTIQIENISGVSCTMRIKIRNGGFFRFGENKDIEVHKISPAQRSINLPVLIPSEYATPRYKRDLDINGSYAGTLLVPPVDPFASIID